MPGNKTLDRYSSVDIHPTAVISPGADIGYGCKIEAYAVIGPHVKLGPNVHLKPHTTITGHTEIGESTIIFPYACIGEIPQDLKFKGETTRLIVGKRNRIREGVTMNTGTEHGGGFTRVGDDCLFMTGSHVGHDVQVGNNVVMANQAALGGHCIIGDNVIIGGLSGVHQFVRIGKGSIIGAVTIVRRDVIPYGLVQGPTGDLEGINLIGLRRRGISIDEISSLKEVYVRLAESKEPITDAIEQIAKEMVSPKSLVLDVIDFARASSGRMLMKPRIL